MIFGIGTDIAQVNRFEKWVENPQMFMRFFNPAEIMEKGSLAAKCQHYAARFAAKEAFSKALGTGIAGFELKEVYVVNDPLGKPELKVEDSGYVSTVLSDLCNCDFIRKYSAFGKTDRDFMYQLTDLYSLFYLKYVKNYHGEDEHYWSHRQMDISSWEGYAFEQVCLHHIPQIKRRLGIGGILSNICTWSCRAFTDAEGNKQPGAQIDLIIDRGDKTINLCEMKFVNHPYSITPDYAAWLIKRRELFKQATGTKKTLHLSMITSFGVEHNAGWQNIQNEVVLDDLFKVE